MFILSLLTMCVLPNSFAMPVSVVTFKINGLLTTYHVTNYAYFAFPRIIDFLYIDMEMSCLSSLSFFYQLKWHLIFNSSLICAISKHSILWELISPQINYHGWSIETTFSVLIDSIGQYIYFSDSQKREYRFLNDSL